MEPNTNTTLNMMEACAHLLAALKSNGSDALEHAERARALVGIDGIRDIGRAMLADPADPSERERGAFLLGALAALLGESDPPETVFGTEASAAKAFDFVSASGYFGVWDGIEG